MKKIMVISFDCFNVSSSNARALGSLLELVDDISLSQIYIKNGRPDYIYGDYCFIDERRLPYSLFSTKKSIEFFSYTNKSPVRQCEKFNNNSNNIRYKKRPLTMFFRNVLWSISSLKIRIVFSWAKKIEPDFVVVQAGDLPALNYIALKIAKQCKSKLIFYSSENYPFKRMNYTNLSKKSFLYNLLRKKLYKSTKKIVEIAEASIFLTESLEDEFRNNYPKMKRSYVIYPCSSVTPLLHTKVNNNIVFSYCGNLGLGRADTLMAVAKIIKNKYPQSAFIVCGKGDSHVTNKLERDNNICFLGYISYEEVIKKYRESDYIFHIESFDDLVSRDSVHAFSGKIADCISTTKPFIFVGPDIMFEYKFLNKTGAALTFNSIDQFEKSINNGILESYVFNPAKQIELKNKYFSNENNKIIMEGIFKNE